MVNVQSLLINNQELEKMFRLTANKVSQSNLKSTILRQLYATSQQPTRNLTSTIVSTTTTNPDQLPQLPVPRLEDTLQKYLRSVQPLLTKDSYKKTEQLASEFCRKNGIGLQLHNLLQQKALHTENWLADWWIKVAYLGFRESVVVNSNPGLYFPTQRFNTQDEWLRYATNIAWASLKYKEMVDTNQLPVDRAGKALLDMGQYRKIFGTCRTPAPEVDKIEYNSNSRHIVVIYRNAFYKVPVYIGDTNEIISESDIFCQLQTIIENSSQNNPAIGILTTEHRDTLAKAYANLNADTQNRSSVTTIEKAAFIICLDKPVPVAPGNDLNVAAHQLIHGGGSEQNSANRWFDKTLQFVINENGINGITYEHSPAEGQPIAILTDFINKHLKESKGSELKGNVRNIEQPLKLKFNLTTAIENDIIAASKFIDKLSSNLDMNVIYFKGYGKNFIKQQKMSPDSYIQMAMQYAFFKYHNEPGAHYETAQQRMFIHGRTETIRSCSLESIAFARAMCANNPNDNDCVKLLRAAVDGHKNYTTMAMSGQGVDRHLLGLKLLAKENNLPLPELYNDESYAKSTHFRISTSQVASSNKAFMCYGPVVEDGYGICYNPRNDDMLFAVSAFKSYPHTSANIMGQHLLDALERMHSLLSRAGEKPKSKM